MNTKKLELMLDKVLDEYTHSVGEMCQRLSQDDACLSKEELLHFIGNETAKALSDYKTIIVDELSKL